MADIQSFADFKLNKQMVSAVEELGIVHPTDVQKKAIPLVLAGHDVLGIAPTGTGKTAAYGLPLLMKVKYAQGTDPRALVLAPTRELAMQIEEQLKKFAVHTDLRIVVLYGGIGPKTQIETVEAGCDIVVATPGRFLDIYLTGHMVLKSIKTLVLDEADKMMDMGFMPQIRRILEVIPVKRQNLLFSATMPPRVVELSHEFLEFPEVVEVAPQSTPVETITQSLYEVPNLRTKINMVEHLLQDKENLNRVIIFTRTKEVADNVGKYLDRKDMGPVRIIHSNKGQNTRINAMNEFKEGNIRVLVTTDVAARGIDVSLVSHVINFQVPIIYEDYVHRIGRTGRANNEGVAITLADPVEMHHIAKIEEIIRMQVPVKPMPKEVEIEKTPFEERQLQARELDLIKRRENPDFKGAFHEKKWQATKGKPKGKGGPAKQASGKKPVGKSSPKGNKKRR
jgi:ATP-dependent RNA helicase RhlE